ncbi:MAG: class I SAM-dependent methyltransferase [Pseudomonadota bacterium]
MGPGPGTTTQSFAERGLKITAVEPGIELARLARERFSRFEDVEIINETFEAWTDTCPSGDFAAIVAAQSFHWLDRATAFPRCAELLPMDGLLVRMEHQPAGRNEIQAKRIQQDYEQYAPSLALRTKGRAPPVQPGRERFHEVSRHMYPHSKVMTADEYIELLGTYSDHVTMPESERTALFDAIQTTITNEFDGQITRQYVAHVSVMERVA